MDDYCSSHSPGYEPDEATGGASPETEDTSPESPESDRKSSHPLPSPSSPPAKRSRRSVQKRVVSIPIGDCEGYGPRPKGVGEGPPPSDSWAWRKYGQKPIKGSPYPRGYYRCSSSKGCPARKQVERSRLDPTMLVITYSFDHNHSWPLPKNPSHPNPTPKSAPAKSAPESGAAAQLVKVKPEPAEVKPEPVEIKPEPEEEERLGGLAEPSAFLMMPPDEDCHWFWEVAPAVSTSAPRSILYAPIFGALDMALPEERPDQLGGDDDPLFAGLGELPECAFVFGRRGAFDVAPCGTTTV